jgi:hypothetical protein
MDLISILATVILFTTIATLVIAIAAYGAYKLREWRKPKKASSQSASSEPIFLDRYQPGASGNSPNPKK